MAGEIQVSGNVTASASTATQAGLTVPLGTPPTVPIPGNMFMDTNRKNLGISGISGGTPVWLQGCVQTQGIQSPHGITVGSPQTIVSFNALDANILNSVGKRLILTGSGMYTTAVAEVPVITLNLFLITKKLIAISSPAVTASLTDKPFWFHFEVLTITAADASSAVLATGIMHITTNTGTVATAIYSTGAATTSIDLSSIGAPLIQAEVAATNLTSININETSLHITN